MPLCFDRSDTVGPLAREDTPAPWGGRGKRGIGPRIIQVGTFRKTGGGGDGSRVNGPPRQILCARWWFVNGGGSAVGGPAELGVGKAQRWPCIPSPPPRGTPEFAVANRQKLVCCCGVDIDKGPQRYLSKGHRSRIVAGVSRTDRSGIGCGREFSVIVGRHARNLERATQEVVVRRVRPRDGMSSDGEGAYKKRAGPLGSPPRGRWGEFAGAL